MARTTYKQGWMLYPWSMAGHHIQGFIASIFILSDIRNLVTWGIVWTIGYLAYQGYSVLQKKDSPGLDVMDYLVGFGAGGIAFAIWELWPILLA